MMQRLFYILKKFHKICDTFVLFLDLLEISLIYLNLLPNIIENCKNHNYVN